jgi:hypothetical protein
MEIEKNVPLPAKNKKTKWPFSKMEVGDSVVVEGKSATSSCPGYSAAAAIGAWKGWSFSGRAIGDNKVRIWRTK